MPLAQKRLGHSAEIKILGKQNILFVFLRANNEAAGGIQRGIRTHQKVDSRGKRPLSMSVFQPFHSASSLGTTWIDARGLTRGSSPGW